MSNTVASSTTTVFVGGGAPVHVGNATTDLVGFYGVSGVAQASALVAVTTTNAIVTGAFGFNTSAQFNAAITAINSLITALKATGYTA